MAAFPTCTNCAVDKSTCKRRADVRQGIAGLSVTSVKFKCDQRKALFQPGDRVVTEWGVPGDYYDGPSRENWSATVIREALPRFVIKIDDAESDFGTAAKDYFKNQTLYVTCAVGRMRLLDEPRRSVCELCGLLSDDLTGECWQPGLNPDPRCIRRAPTPSAGEGR